MTLGEKLMQARKAAGLTQADIAAKLHVSRQAVSRWESGQSKPSTEKLLALGELYGVSIDQLLNTENTEKPTVETTSDEPEAVPVETVISEKHRPRAWLKYMVAALCGALLMLAILLMLKLPEDTHNEPTSEIKYDDISGVSFGEPFDLHGSTDHRLKWAFMGGNTNEKVLSAFRIHTACIEHPPAERLFFAFP